MFSWWQTGIVYQIYPRSFQDSAGDGIGDIPGIRQRLDYLLRLGIKALWISPIYPSPMADFGYDVSDYVNVHPVFGTLADLDALITAAHKRNLKIILDFVPNHTSDQHPWFQESRTSRSNPKAEWYIWHDPAPDGGPPNNWLSRFDGETAWEWEEMRGQYYLHSFLKEQPDLNWRNPEVRAAMLDVLRFWFDRGVDGFRVDVSYRVMKDRQFRNNPPDPDWQKGTDPSRRVEETYTKDTPDIHEFNRWLRQVADEYEDRVLVGEINLPLPRLVAHYGDGDEFHLPFNFHLIFTDWTATAVRALVDRYESLLPAGAWPNWVLGNHDQHRVASRIGPRQARVALTLLLTLRGTPTLYYGDEIGMVDGEIPPESVQDPWEKLTPGIGLGRDPERTPMQWNGTKHAGFCPPETEPWLPVNEDFAVRNVAAQQSEPGSMLRMTQALVRLRQERGALYAGEIRTLPATEGLLAYVRYRDEEYYLVILNFTGKEIAYALPADFTSGRVLFSTKMDGKTAVSPTRLTLRPNEGIIWSPTR